jgi:C_GCAxxG_C_C family probable redox protein
MKKVGIEARAAELFDEGYYCAESVLLSVAEAAGKSEGLSPEIATGFCSGMSRTAGPCGAVTGAVMALGLVSGRSDADQSVEQNYQQTRQMVERFRERFGSGNCSELLGCDLGTAEGQARFRDQRLGERCREYTIAAAALAGEIAALAQPDSGKKAPS